MGCHSKGSHPAFLAFSFPWFEDFEERSDPTTYGFFGAFCRLSQEAFVLGDDLLGRAEVEAIGGQVLQLCVGGTDCRADGGNRVWFECRLRKS